MQPSIIELVKTENKKTREEEEGRGDVGREQENNKKDKDENEPFMSSLSTKEYLLLRYIVCFEPNHRAAH